MERASALIAVLLLAGVSSVHSLNCLTCSHRIDGGTADSACVKGQATSSLPSSDPICVVYGLFDSDKALLKVTRSSYSEASLPMSNSECYQTTDAAGKTVYVTLCTCTTDNCNDFVVNNCRCERPEARWSLVSRIGTDSMDGINIFFMIFVLVAIALLLIMMLFIVLFIDKRFKMLTKFLQASTLRYDSLPSDLKMADSWLAAKGQEEASGEDKS